MTAHTATRATSAPATSTAHASTDAPAIEAIVSQASADAAAAEREMQDFLYEMDQVKEFARALGLAAQSNDAATSLYWPALMAGLQRLIPTGSAVESRVSQAMNAMQVLTEATARQAANAGVGPARATSRAALAANASRPA